VRTIPPIWRQSARLKPAGCCMDLAVLYAAKPQQALETTSHADEREVPDGHCHGTTGGRSQAGAVAGPAIKPSGPPARSHDSYRAVSCRNCFASRQEH
jgi:hypothetical protein